ncbi:MAG TPA: hypothetical protein VHX99_08425 [Rhizomicrobium sp.]|nr:hypothetical protein [Rhizomicrobium sp.]
MHKFLAKPALVDRILVLERAFGRGVQVSGGFGDRGLFVNMGLNCQALKEKSQQSEKRYPALAGC